MTRPTKKVAKKAPKAKKLTVDQRRIAELEGLVDGQRRDFDQLASLLQVRDSEFRNLQATVEGLNQQAGKLIHDLQRRLGCYERVIVPIRKAKQALDAADKRARRAAELAAAKASENGTAKEGE